MRRSVVSPNAEASSTIAPPTASGNGLAVEGILVVLVEVDASLDGVVAAALDDDALPVTDDCDGLLAEEVAGASEAGGVDVAGDVDCVL